MIDVEIIPILGDHMNYAYLLKGSNGETAIVDPGEAGPIIEELDKQGLKLDYVLNTHHHWDHTDGNADLIEKYGSKLVGPDVEYDRIKDIDIKLKEGDIFTFGDEDIQTLETPGHTSDHICFYLPDSKIVFTGDTLFIMSCGWLYEGTPQQMWSSLQKITALPDDTQVYCGHEYTLDNAEFCRTIEPQNQDIRDRYEEIKTLREQGKPTVPSTVALEKKTNTFLRAGSSGAFAHIRELKNNFKK